MKLGHVITIVALTSWADCTEQDFFSHVVENADGEVVSLERFRGKAVLVVNVASECGFTDGHYKDLVKMQNILGQSGQLNILAFPCNQFGGQEPQPIKEIVEFVTKTYKVNFPIFGKIDVIGDNADPLYQHLIEKSGQKPNWNFWKYLVDGKGNVLGAWGPWSDVQAIFADVKKAVDDAKKMGARKPSRQTAHPAVFQEDELAPPVVEDIQGPPSRSRPDEETPQDKHNTHKPPTVHDDL